MEFFKKFTQSGFFKYAVGLALIAIAYAVHLIDGEGAMNFIRTLFGM